MGAKGGPHYFLVGASCWGPGSEEGLLSRYSDWEPLRVPEVLIKKASDQTTEKGYIWKKDEKGLQVAINPQDKTIQDLISQLHFELAESKLANHKITCLCQDLIWQSPEPPWEHVENM